MKKTIKEFIKQDTPLVCLTAYTAPIAKIADQYCDLLLVGDSVAMTVYGEDGTRSANMEMMIRHGRAVSKIANNSLVIVDMPFGSYENNPMQALKNAQRLMDETGCDGVKLEGGENRASTIKYLVQNDIPVMGHIGLLPQTVTDPSGFKVQGHKNSEAQQLMRDAKSIEEAGAFSLVIEAVPQRLAGQLTDLTCIPTIGIGASTNCSGQILVTDDMLGLFLGHTPKFVKKYTNLGEQINQAIQCYSDEVKTRKFPALEHTYKDSTNSQTKKIA